MESIHRLHKICLQALCMSCLFATGGTYRINLKNTWLRGQKKELNKIVSTMERQGDLQISGLEEQPSVFYLGHPSFIR